MKPFFDTSILIYAIHEGQGAKYEVADELVQRYLVDGGGIISVQVLREFYSVSQRLANPLSGGQAQRMVEYFSTFDTLSEDASMVLGAVRRTREFSLSFWDALIVEAALKGGADRLLTEDLQHGQEIGGLRIENPFL